MHFHRRDQVSPLSLSVRTGALLLALFNGTEQAQATVQFQKVFIDDHIRNHPDEDYAKFMRRKARCLICHQGKGGKHDNIYGKPMAELLDHEADKKNVEKISAAIAEVNKLPYDPSNPDGETFGDRIAASKLPAADDLETLEVEPPAEVVSLFDGESLSGWIGDTESYEVRDGVLASIAGTNGKLYTEQQYADFELKLEFRLTPGANNGIGVRTPLEGDPAYQGIELQVLDNTAEKYADLKPYQYHGSAYGVAAAEQGHLKPVGEWNEQLIRCEGRQVTVVLNGETILDINLDQVAPDGQTVDGQEHLGLQRSSGHIALLGHGDVVEFRQIQLIEIASGDEEDAEESDEE